MKERWITVKEFKEKYKLSNTLAYRYIHAKEFPSKKFGTATYRIDDNKVSEWFEKSFNF